jgi:excisionase family DNA binding protein
LQLVSFSDYDSDAMAWLDLDDLEDYLKIPKSTLYRLAREGRLPGHKIGRAWRFSQSEVDEWIKAGRQHTEQTKRGDGKP